MADEEITRLIEWARREAGRVRNAYPAIGAFAPGVEFLRRYAGNESDFYLATRPIVDAARYTGSEAARNALVAMASLLESWADYAESGLATALPFAVASRVEAATDLMQQVADLLAESDIHPAAPVMLAGAALEEFLRGLWESTSEPIAGRLGLVSYGEALRKSQQMSPADVKEVIALASIRNDAAHGRFDDISRERASLFADRVNLFLRTHAPAGL